ncbi:MAG: hypothetical protein ACFFBP_01635 [Promethearchaeota archaeon]
MPYEYSPPKKMTMIVSLALEILGIIMACIGVFEMVVPFLETVVGVPVVFGITWSVLITIIGVTFTGLAWFIFFLGVKLRGV